MFKDKIVPLKSLNKYLYNGKSEMKVNIVRTRRIQKKKNTAAIVQLITAECAWVVHVYISCTKWSDRL